MALNQDLSVFSCGLCRGVFTSDQERSDHKAKCDGSVRNSSALLFVCERKFYLRICADVNKSTPYVDSSESFPPRKRGRPKKDHSYSTTVRNIKSDNFQSNIELPQHENTVPPVSDTAKENLASSEHNYHLSQSPGEELVDKLSDKGEDDSVGLSTQRRSGRKRKKIIHEDFIDESELKSASKNSNVVVKEEGEISYLDDESPEDDVDDEQLASGEEVVEAAQAFAFSKPDLGKKPANSLYCRYQRYIKPSTYDGPPEKAVYMCPECPAQITPVETFVIHLKACKPANRSKAWRQACEEKYKHLAVDIPTTLGPKRTVYKCNICQKISRAAGLMDRHMSTTHALEWNCKKCDLTFETRQKYSRHMDKHVKPHMCEFCSERFSQKKDMIRHTWTHTGIFPLKCNECDYKCRHSRALKEHKRCHTGYLLKCKIAGCNFVTQWDAAYSSHMASRHQEKTKYICKQCPYRTNTKGCYDKHLLTHLGLKRFKCSLCAYKAVQKSDIVKHLRKKHLKQQSYFCDRCPFSSGYSHGFRIHMMQHMGIKPWQCSLCGYNSVTKQKLLRHIANRHQDKEGQCINLGLKLDLKFSQYIRPSEDMDRPDHSFIEEEHGTVRLLMRDEDDEESERVVENDVVEENIIYEADSKLEEQVVYIISELEEEGGPEVVSDYVTTTTDTSTLPPRSQVVEAGYQIQTEDGTLLNIPNLSSIQELSHVVTSSGAKTYFIKSESLINNGTNPGK